MRTVIILLAFVIAVFANQNTRIVGGVDVDIEKYPFLASLQFSWFGTVWQITCGGTIITARTILSAASCFHGFNSPPHWRVRVGSSYATSGGEIVTIERFILHHGYEDYNNDVAIVRLVNTLTLSASVGTARIAGPRYDLPVEAQLTTMGWGRTIWAGSFPEKLQEVGINVIDQQLCWERYEYLRTLAAYEHYPEINSGMFCAGIQGRGSCLGDFGGPLIQDGDVVVGIASFGYGCADFWYPTVNVRISNFVSWIVAYGY